MGTKTLIPSDYMYTKKNLVSFSWLQILSVINNTECGKLLEEIKCALCSPNSQSLFHSPDREVLDRDLVLPLLCKDYCKEFFYTCRSHLPGKNPKSCVNNNHLCRISPSLVLQWKVCLKMDLAFQISVLPCVLPLQMCKTPIAAIGFLPL